MGLEALALEALALEVLAVVAGPGLLESPGEVPL